MTVQHDLQVRIDVDRKRATLVCTGKLEAQFVTAEIVIDVARKAGVAIDKDVITRVAGAVNEYAKAPREMTAEISVARLPGPPVDGGIVWQPQFDPNAVAAPEAGGWVDHYAARKTIPVRPGDCVAMMRRPAEGTDGRDVTGRVLKTRAAKSCATKLGRGLTLDDSGRIMTTIAGVLEADDANVKVVEFMEVPGDVDFNTGNIDFVGAVSVIGGVKPCFIVKATGDVTIGGLVEDAITIAGGSLECRRGLTAKSRGDIKVTLDARAVFFNCMTGEVGRKLCAERELMNCNLLVRGDVVSPRACLLGGQLTVNGSVELNELGAEQWRDTDLVLGWSVRASIDSRLADIKAQYAPKKAMHDQIMALGKRATATQRESVTELQFQLWEMDQEIAKLNASLGEHTKLVQLPPGQSPRFVQIHKWIHPKSRITLGTNTIAFSVAIRGPVRIYMDAHDQLVATVGSGEPRLLTELAKGVARRSAA